jgi:hypothetical protein
MGKAECTIGGRSASSNMLSGRAPIRCFLMQNGAIAVLLEASWQAIEGRRRPARCDALATDGCRKLALA